MSLCSGWFVGGLLISWRNGCGVYETGLMKHHTVWMMGSISARITLLGEFFNHKVFLLSSDSLDVYVLLAGLHEWSVTPCGWCKPLLWVTCCRSSCLISCWVFSSERRQICSKCIFLNVLISSRFKLKTVAVSLSSLRRPKRTMSTTPRQQTLLLSHRNRILAHVSFSWPLWTSLYIEMALLQVTLALPWQPPLAFGLGL